MFLFVSGNFETNTLSCFARWDRFFCWWYAGACSFTLLCVREKSLCVRCACHIHSNLLLWSFRYQRSTTAISVGTSFSTPSHFVLVRFTMLSIKFQLCTCLFDCSCSNLLCTSCCCPGWHLPQVRGDVRHVVEPRRPYVRGQHSCPGAASAAWESQEFHVLLLICWAERTGSGSWCSFWIVS